MRIVNTLLSLLAIASVCGADRSLRGGGEDQEEDLTVDNKTLAWLKSEVAQTFFYDDDDAGYIDVANNSTQKLTRSGYGNVRVHYNMVEVHYTPNDGGSQEEWRMKFKLVAFTYPGYIRDYAKTYKSVKEKEHETYSLDVDLEVRFRKGVLWTGQYLVGKPIWFVAYGNEDEHKWPNRDDKLPSCAMIRNYRSDLHGRVEEGSCAKAGYDRKYTIYLLQHSMRSE